MVIISKTHGMKWQKGLQDMWPVQKLTLAKMLKKYKKPRPFFYKLIRSRIFIPNSPTLFNAGKTIDKQFFNKEIEDMTIDDYKQIFNLRTKHNMLSACFVVPMEDSLASIFDAVKMLP